MCSVVGYVGDRMSRAFVMKGLERLEYRGYDSAGFACLSPDNHRLQFVKSAGRLAALSERLELEPIDGHIGIGHTRWSTHGVASEKNAHPHFDCHKTISLVHNGIIENSHALRTQLADSGHTFHSDTDTEAIAHLFEALCVAHKTFKAALADLVGRLEGAYAFIAIMQDLPDVMVLVRKRSPLCVGIGDDEMFIASDTVAFAGKTDKVLFLPDESFALVRKHLIELYDFEGNALPIETVQVQREWDAAEKHGHEHYMLKEIYEQKMAIHDTVEFLASITDDVWNHMGIERCDARELDKLYVIGCGTSWHAARIAQFFFEAIALLPTRTLLASEFRYMPFFSHCKKFIHRDLAVGRDRRYARGAAACQQRESNNRCAN